MSYNEHYWRIMTGKAFWLNPLTIIFIVIVLIGTVSGVKPDSTLAVDMGKSLMGMAFIFAIIGCVCASVAWFRDPPKHKE
jgi:hypothetical protein